MIDAIENRTLIEKSLLAATGASAGLLIGAHLFENLGGLAPCALCLDQREAHWTGLALSTAGLIIATALKWRRAAIATVGACALVYLVSAGLAFYHAGVENHYWPGPATCSGGGPVEIAPGGLIDILDQKPAGPSCSEAAWRLLGVSMAGYNLLISSGLFAFCLIAAAAAAREERRSAHGKRAEGAAL
ncbi:MAG: disulfide bond formation protein B [Parvularculaceae bacterium]|nr:disulfide bond formation protein B [Parvularculaceae bacterium]